MCGFIGYTGLPTDRAVLKNMTDRIAHRGPDDAQYYCDEDVALGFRRLSIIDLEGGAQPLENEDGSLVLVFNGEIYNYEALREELLKAGHTFKTHSDSEVLLHGYEQYGDALLPKLRGMFAFVIWDKRRKSLFGARDFFGIKPFYYARMGEAFLFGSEIKGFLPHPAFKKELNDEALEHYLSFQYSVGTDTFFKNVFKLPPAHCLRYQDGELTISRYWEPTFDAEAGKTEEEWAAAVADVIADSVEAHKVSDVEVGSFLSSGIDSSYIAACADVDKTFTVGFDGDSHYNEIRYAEELSDILGVDNHSHVITPDEFWDTFPLIQYHMDEPLADPAAAALFFVCRTARQHVKVALSGEGADELFGGYNIYCEPLELPAYDKIPFPLRRLIGAVAARLPAKRGLNFLVRRGKRLEDRFIGGANMFSEKERRRLLKSPVGAPAPKTLCRPFYDKVQDQDDVTKMQYLDLHMWLAGDILLKADKMSMANSLEVRVPYLDRCVMALAGRIPTAHRVTVRPNVTKRALRRAAADKLPQKWYEKRKLGFPVPIRVWLKEERYYNKVKTAFESEAARRFFRTDALMRLLDRHRRGKEDNSRRIWTVYTFLVWYHKFFVEEPSESI